MPLTSTVIKKTLPAGKYAVKVVSWEERENEQGGNVLVVFQFPDRIIKHAFFPKNINYLGSCLRNQMGRKDEDLTVAELLDAAEEFDDLFAVISYNSFGMNIALHESVVTEDEEVTA